MSPKDKAIELVQKFPLNGIILKSGDAPKQYKGHNKQCALICIDEIITEILNIQEPHERVVKCNYYQKVKQEIEKL